MRTRRTKYGNRKTRVGTLVFASKKEARRWGELCLLERAGLVCNLQRQVRYPLVVNGVLVCEYRADHCYLDMKTGAVVVEDVKSPPTRKIAAYVIKKKLMLACHGIVIQEV